MQLRGQYVVLALVAVGISAAAFAWFYQRSLTDRALALWGGETAAAIREPERVEYLVLARGEGDPRGEGEVTIAGQKVQIAHRQEITAAPGMKHATQALLENASFDAIQTAGTGSPQWSAVLVVTRGPTRATIAFDFVNRRVRYEETGRELALGERLLKGLPVFFADVAKAEAK
jgi:hypothetical protein